MAIADYFFDPILRAPTIGSMLVCMTSGLIGVTVFLRRQSLLGEALSHASFPGVILGVIAAGLLGLGPYTGGYGVALLIIIGAFATALLGAFAIRTMVRSLKVSGDSALCFVLSVFFGVGLTLASQVQVSFSALYQQIFVYLYGQTATMTDLHLQIYLFLALLTIGLLFLFYKEIQTVIFDQSYAETIGVRRRLIENILLILAALAVVIGIRSVGVVLMSAMLIAPAAAARQFTDKLSLMFLGAALFGLASGFFGVYISSEVTAALAASYPGERLSLPTGPIIVVVGSALCFLSLLFAPKRGLLLRYVRIVRFRYVCLCENLLKSIWRSSASHPISFEEIVRYQSASKLYLRFIVMRLLHHGWVERHGREGYGLTAEGRQWAEKIVRLHRLWEVYLADYLGVGVERVHRSAEEMEHIITPELEQELTLLLNDPKRDPHQQPIPPKAQGVR